MLNTAVRGDIRSMKIIPREKIWTPDPEKYSMTACIGSDFAGLTQRGQLESSKENRLYK
jgi:hypothetical protein